MMSYTLLKDERIEKKIDQDMQIICEEILKVIRPVSIILFGGFGKGEGSAQVIGDEVVVSKDYDTLVVVTKRLSPAVIYQLTENIHQRLGRTNPLDSVTMEMGSGATIVQYTIKDLLYFRDAKTYEIKAASKLIWGEDIREKIPLRAEDLSPWNGIRFLLRKPPGLCGCFLPRYMEAPPEGEDKKTLVHECLRVYLDGGVMLTLLAGNYQPTYSARASAIREAGESFLPDLVREIPDLAKKILYFTDLKLSPDESKYDDIDPVRLWFETRKDMGIMLRYFMEQHSGKKSEGWAELFDEYTAAMNRGFLDELAYFYLKKRFKIANKPLVRLASIAYQRLFCLKYVLKLHQKEHVFLFRTLLEFPTFRVSTTGLKLLFSLNEDGSLDDDLFSSFISSLGRIYPVRIHGNTGADRWLSAVDNYMRAERTFLDTFYGWG